MNKTHKNLLVATLILAYALVLGFFNFGTAPNTGPNTAAEAANHYAAPLADNGFHLPQSTKTVTQPTHAAGFSVKESKHNVGTVPLFSAALKHAFKQRQAFSHGLLLNLRRADLLFPAHFFW